MAIVSSLIFPLFLTFLLIFMNMKMKFSFRRMASIHLSYDITGSIIKWHNDSLGLKEIYGIFERFFLSFFNVFIKIHEYAN